MHGCVVNVYNISHATLISMCITYIYIGDGRPTAREYLRFLTTYCVDWKAIGLQLGLEQAALNVIGANNRDRNRECLRLTLESWLQMDIHATWSKLELAITNANRANLGIDPLDTSKADITSCI